MSDGHDRWPEVSVIMPVRNEAAGLATAVRSVLDQGYTGALGVYLAVAPSDDDTEGVAARLAASHPAVHVVPNPTGTTPAGLNAAIAESAGEIIVRVDGHARLHEGYVRRAVDTMRRTGAVNVGGVQRAVGHTPFERAVALAMTSWLGTGGARFHVGGHEGPVDTVYLGVFRRDALEAVGGFDERLIRNQDYELNIRLREAGGSVWFDPALSVEYRPRSTWRRLARQYFEYGWWKAEVARTHPGSLRLRQAAPVALTGALLLAVPLRRWWPARYLPAAYLAASTLAAARLARHQPELILRSALVVPTMHLTWGAGFLAAVGSRWRRRLRGGVG